MSQDQLALFESSPNRQQVRFALIISAILFAAFLVTLTLPDAKLGELPAFIPVMDAILMVGDLIIATLLFAQASVFRSRALLALATGYLFTGLIVIPHALTFPGAFTPGGLLGAGVSTAGLIYVFWRAALPLAIIAYLLFKNAPSPGRQRIVRPALEIAFGASLAILLVIAVTFLVTRGHNLLPHTYLNYRDVNYATVLGFDAVLIALFLVAIAMLVRQRKSLLDLWLLVAAWAWLIQLMLIPAMSGRFTLVWYCAEAAGLISHLIVMLALIAETNRIYARLAVLVLAQQREREGRLMSMDAVASAIAHEVKQPLTAIVANASAALRWLDRGAPDPESIARPLRAIRDDGYRTADVIESIRAIFGDPTGERRELDLNALVRETASLMGRDLSGEDVTLQLDLDNALPTVTADRVQLQQVIINLLTNAIESIAEVRGRARLLTVRSTSVDGDHVLVTVSDTGKGIDPERIHQIFDAFVTTKTRGTGMGLALCRSIVEAHGGRLWASAGEPHGATFHVQIPSLGGIDDR